MLPFVKEDPILLIDEGTLPVNWLLLRLLQIIIKNWNDFKEINEHTS